MFSFSINVIITIINDLSQNKIPFTKIRKRREYTFLFYIVFLFTYFINNFSGYIIGLEILHRAKVVTIETILTSPFSPYPLAVLVNSNIELERLCSVKSKRSTVFLTSNCARWISHITVCIVSCYNYNIFYKEK